MKAQKKKSTKIREIRVSLLPSTAANEMAGCLQVGDWWQGALGNGDGGSEGDHGEFAWVSTWIVMDKLIVMAVGRWKNGQRQEQWQRQELG